MAIFNSYVKLPEGRQKLWQQWHIGQDQRDNKRQSPDGNKHKRNKDLNKLGRWTSHVSHNIAHSVIFSSCLGCDQDLQATRKLMFFFLTMFRWWSSNHQANFPSNHWDQDFPAIQQKSPLIDHFPLPIWPMFGWICLKMGYPKIWRSIITTFPFQQSFRGVPSEKLT